uniref:Uncharacterized protein n=1 Tax=Glossina palpalis gambiensis TaxID=67801 RepID=A0A1B0BYG2_9MUSC
MLAQQELRYKSKLRKQHLDLENNYNFHTNNGNNNNKNNSSSKRKNLTASPAASESLSSSPDRVLTRSATCLALLGIALSSFSLKQMLANSTNKSSSIP